MLRCALLLLVLILSLPLATLAQDFLLSCAEGTEHHRVGPVNLCVPTGENGYALLSSDKHTVTFKEQFFAGRTRVFDVSAPNLNRPDGTPVTVVLTTILDEPGSTADHVSIARQFAEHQSSLLQNDTTVLAVDLEGEGSAKVTVRRLKDRLFHGEADVTSSYRHWLVALVNGSVDYVLRCERRGLETKRYGCDGEVPLGKTSAAVLLIGEVLSDLPLAFEGNRDIVRSFVVP
jgi:hypothetical protein